MDITVVIPQAHDASWSHLFPSIHGAYVQVFQDMALYVPRI